MDPVSLIDKVEMRIKMHDVRRGLFRVRCYRCGRDRMIAARDVGNRPCVEQRAHRLLGIGEAAPCIGIDEIENTLRSEGVEHGNFTDRAGSETRAYAIALCRIDRHTQYGEVGSVK
jgi:hypothetical protein